MRALPRPITTLMRQAGVPTDAGPDRAQTPGVLLSPAGAAGVSPVLDRRVCNAGGLVFLPSRPAACQACAPIETASLEAGGAFEITGDVADCITVWPTKTEGISAWA